MACQKVCKQGRNDIIVKVNLQSLTLLRLAIFRVAFGHLYELITKALKEAWTLKEAFSVFVVKLYGFCLSIVRRRHPYMYTESLPTL